MGRSGIIVTGLVGVALVIGGIVVLGNKSNKDQSTTIQHLPPITSSTPAGSSSGTQASAATINYTSSGFSPNKITVKKGDSVTIKNNSSFDMQFNSDPHPVHTDNSDLNVGTVGPGKSMTFTVSMTGTWGYHNHLDSSQKGTIVVQ